MIIKFKPHKLLDVMIPIKKKEKGEVYAEKQICVKQAERKIKSYLQNYNGNESQFKKIKFCVNEIEIQK